VAYGHLLPNKLIEVVSSLWADNLPPAAVAIMSELCHEILDQTYPTHASYCSVALDTIPCYFLLQTACSLSAAFRIFFRQLHSGGSGSMSRRDKARDSGDANGDNLGRMHGEMRAQYVQFPAGASRAPLIDF